MAQTDLVNFINMLDGAGVEHDSIEEPEFSRVMVYIDLGHGSLEFTFGKGGLQDIEATAG